MDGLIVFAVLVAAVAAFGLAAIRFGADSRDTRWAILG
jgi:hypothetical protein